MTTLMILGIFGALEMGVRNYASTTELRSRDVKALISDLATMHISGREVKNQMLVHNAALFSRFPVPSSIGIGYVGTSRTKVLRSEHFGIPGAVVGAGNSYNEISYGLLLQAELLRLIFPNLKRVYFESSMLLRRPDRLRVEADHEKYLPLLRSLQPLCMQLPASSGCRPVFKAVIDKQGKSRARIHSELLNKRSELRFAALFSDKKENGIPVMDDPLFAGLQANGERKNLSRAVIPKKDQVAEITHDNVKVQRLREVKSYGRGDDLFEMIELWGRKYGIEVVLFQPPVRSDLYRYKVDYGLAQHVADIERIARKYDSPFIDLNRPELGYVNDWSLFGDEDHLETCIGSGLLTLALDAGYERYRTAHEILPRIERRALQSTQSKNLEICTQL
ncbi:MAG: hypothetical protein ABIQ03_04305 [Burkholderiales bacterium]